MKRDNNMKYRVVLSGTFDFTVEVDGYNEDEAIDWACEHLDDDYRDRKMKMEVVDSVATEITD